METASVLGQPEPSHVPAGRFSLGGFCLCLAVGPAVGLIWAWLAEEAQSYAAPFILFPMLVGVFAGLSIVATARYGQIGHRPTIVLAVVLAAAVAAVGQHYFSYAAFVSRYSSGKGDKGGGPIFAGAKTGTVPATSAGGATGADLLRRPASWRPASANTFAATPIAAGPCWASTLPRAGRRG